MFTLIRAPLGACAALALLCASAAAGAKPIAFAQRNDGHGGVRRRHHDRSAGVLRANLLAVDGRRLRPLRQRPQRHNREIAYAARELPCEAMESAFGAGERFRLGRTRVSGR